MTTISIGTVHADPTRWVAFALEADRNALVACTSSNQSANEATKNLKGTLLRLGRYSELDESHESSQIPEIGRRIAKLIKGSGQPFSLDEISLKNWSPARLAISKKLLQVPRGMVISYGELAKQSNSSPRGVGSVMRSNPVPWAIPCHRVIHSDGRLGKLGGSTSGTKEKARILQAEGVLFERSGKVDPKSVYR